MNKIRIGISSCLLGVNVRYDGGHKRDRFITDTLARWCEFVPVCPEVECGLPVPRESMRLVRHEDGNRLITGVSGVDHTEKMKKWIDRKLPELDSEDLTAFIFKTKSPSSGLHDVKVYGKKGQPVSHRNPGLFAEAFIRRFPDTPVEDEGRLHNPAIREKFIETIFVLQRWREREHGTKGIVEFHTRHKYTFMAHSPKKAGELGKIVASAGKEQPERLTLAYRNALLGVLNETKTVKKNYNVLLHMIGYFKKLLTPDEKAELLEQADLYYKELHPIIVPLTLIRHYSRKYSVDYLQDQYFLNPHPLELGLLNHV